MCATELAYCYGVRSTDISECYEMRGTELAYGAAAGPIISTLLTAKVYFRSIIGLPAVRVRSYLPPRLLREASAHIAYGTTCYLAACYAMPGTAIAFCAVRLRDSYAMPGTVIAYSAIRYNRY
eukprot:1148560-Rhodomonas_salina.2